MDFNADLARAARAILDHYEVEYSDLSDGHAIVERWANVQLKLIKPSPRTVFKSHRSTQASLAEKVEKELAFIEHKCKQGDDLNPHLSKRIFRKDFTDHLFADWGIYHLHLSCTLEGRYFMTRSDQLLFAVFLEDRAYFIDIRPHGEDYVFAQKALLSALCDEWPHVLEPYRLKGVVDLKSHVDDPEQIHNLRKSGISVMHKVGDAVYAPMGGGITTAATSLRVRMEVNRLYRQAKEAHELVTQKKAEILERISQATGRSPTEFDPHLELTEKGFYIVDSVSMCGFPLYV